MRRITARIVFLVAFAATLLMLPGTAHAGVIGCTVNNGDADLALDATGTSFFNVYVVDAGDLQVQDVGGAGIVTPCAGITQATITSLSISGTGGAESVQLYTEHFPPGTAIDVNLGTGVDNFSTFVDQGIDADNNVAYGAAGVDLDGGGDEVDIALDSSIEIHVLNTYGGDDTIDLTGPGSLGGPVASMSTRGGTGNDTIFGSASAESIRGESGADVVHDGAGADQVLLGDGNDTLVVSATVDAGDDYEAEGDTDTIDFSARSVGVTVTFGDNTNNDGQTGGAENDDIGEFEAVIGTPQDDVLNGSANTVAMSFTGGDGDDAYTGTTLSDTYIAGAADDGSDTITDAGGIADHATYAARSATLDLTLDGGAGDGVAGEGDNIPTSIEVVTGGSAGDSFIGTGTGGATFNGGGGDDAYVGYVDGASSGILTDAGYVEQGTDTLSSIQEAAISILAAGGTVTATGFNGPVSVTGSSGNDTITTGGGFDTVNAEGGNDVVDTGGGNDTITGGDGTDTLAGGAGPDTMQESGDQNVTATGTQLTWSGGDVDGITGMETLQVTGGASANAIDVSAFSGVVSVDGQGGNDVITLSGSSAADNAVGGGGTDTIVLSTDATTFTITNSTLVANGTDTIDGFEVAQLSGGPGNNTFNASAFTGSATLTGNSGDDTFVGTSSNDTIIGGTGTGDALPVTSTGSVVLSNTSLNAAGMGTDAISGIEVASITGGPAAQLLNAGAFTGTTTITPGAGADTVTGGSGSVTLVASGSGTITLTDASLLASGETDSLSGIDTARLTGSAGDDVVSASSFSGALVLDADAGNDTITGAIGSDTLTAGGGTDQLVLTGVGDLSLSDTASTGTGSDALSGFETATITGGAAAQAINATGFTGTTTITPGAGADTVTGGSGTDTLVGGGDGMVTLTSSSLLSDGETDVLAGLEVAQLTGGTGADTIDASAFAGTVTIDAGAGNDTVTGSTGSDTLTGGEGTDRVKVTGSTTITLTDTSLIGAGTDSIGGFETATLTGGSGADTITASGFTAGSVSIVGGAGADRITGSPLGDIIAAGGGNDRVVSGAGNDTITGAAGNDILNGGAGRDRITGGAGADTITGGTGADRLDGGAGNDRLNTRDRTRDTSISCGAGSRDRATVDITRFDRTVRLCETITRR
jgi:Ca2+-binding RTX toxin-like protein